MPNYFNFLTNALTNRKSATSVSDGLDHLFLC